MPRKPPTVTQMTPGQLKLHFASICQSHGADGVTALGRVHRFTTEELRRALLDYETAAAREDWPTAEDALLRIAA